MDTLNISRMQLGLSGTASNNFTITAENEDGNLVFARGNLGSAISTVLSVDQDDKVVVPGSINITGKLTTTTPLETDLTRVVTTEYVNNYVGVDTMYYYRPMSRIIHRISVGTRDTAFAFDSSGNLYWAYVNYYNGTTYNQTSYIYKMTPDGLVTQFTSQATVGAHGTSLAFDSSGNLYWAITSLFNGTNYSTTSYVYKITPGGTLTTFASQATVGAYGTSLAFDSSGNLYWAYVNYYNGTTYNQTSYVYKITSGGTKTQFASQATTGGYRTDLKFDSGGNLYWAVTNYYNGTTYSLTSYVYKITSGGTKTQFASQATTGAIGTSLAFDSNENLYWAISNYFDGSTRALTAYVYKITPEGTNTQFASQATTGAVGTSLAFDSNENLYWTIANYYNGSSYSAFQSFVACSSKIPTI